MRMFSFVLKGSIISFLVIVCLALMLIWLPTLWGWHNFKVMSNSMYPALKAGDIIIVRPINPSQLSEGDIVSFQVSGSKVVTHRIHNITDDAIITKGDANTEPDPVEVYPNQIFGKVVLMIPLGRR